MRKSFSILIWLTVFLFFMMKISINIYILTHDFIICRNIEDVDAKLLVRV